MTVDIKAQIAGEHYKALEQLESSSETVVIGLRCEMSLMLAIPYSRRSRTGFEKAE
jgi:hypothetical protein